MPERRCSACREQRPAHQLIRLVASPAGEVVPDLRRRAPGRAAYACPVLSCLERASKGAASRSLKRRVQKGPEGALVGAVRQGLERLLAERLGRLQRQRGLVIGLADTQSADAEAGLSGVVAAVDLSERSAKKVDAFRAPVYRVARQTELGSWLGRSETGVVGVPKGPLGEKALTEAALMSRLQTSVVG